MQKSIRVGMIGYKFMGKAHSNAYRQAPFFFDLPLIPKLQVICGRDKAGVSDAARKFGWEDYETSWEKVISREDVDLVDINSPTYNHAEIAIAAAKQGKHVFLEKPMAMNLDQAKAIAKAAKVAGVKHMIGFNYRKLPAIAYARNMIDEGKIGNVYHFRSSFLMDWIMDPQFPLIWRLDKNIAGSGALGDLCSHHLDMAQYLVGDIASVSATAKTFIQERPLPVSSEGLSAIAGKERGRVTVDDAVLVIARFKNGGLGSFEASRFAAGHKATGVFEINGSKGSIRFSMQRLNELDYASTEDRNEQGFRNILTTDPTHPYMNDLWPPGHVIGWEHSHINQVCHLLKAIAEDRMPEPSFYDGLKNQAVLEAITQSIENGKWHDVEDVSP